MRISDWSSDVCSSDLPVLSACKAVEGGRSFFQRRGRKNGASTSSARTEVKTSLGARPLAADKPLDKVAPLWSKARMAEVKLHPDWLAAIGGEFEQPYMAALKQFLAGERAKGKAIYPRPRDWFAALDATPPRDVRGVILGQDPYHRAGRANEIGTEACGERGCEDG